MGIDKHPGGHPKLADSGLKGPTAEVRPAESRPVRLACRVILFKRLLLSAISGLVAGQPAVDVRSEEHPPELPSLMRTSSPAFWLTKKSKLTIVDTPALWSSNIPNATHPALPSRMHI